MEKKLNNEAEIEENNLNEKDILEVTSMARQIPDSSFQDLNKKYLQCGSQENDVKEETDDEQIEEKSISINQIWKLLGFFETVISASVEMDKNV